MHHTPRDKAADPGEIIVVEMAVLLDGDLAPLTLVKGILDLKPSGDE